MMKEAIKICNLSKKYQNINTSSHKKEFEYVLKNISFDINKGDVVGIIGANGAGKSTLLKILSGITSPTEGEIIIDGKVASILELGVGFDPEISGYDNLFNGGQLLGFSKKEIRKNIISIIEFSGLKKNIYTPLKFYSSGMILRLAYSLVINVYADILLFDEILAVGDMEFSQKVIGEIFQKVKNKKTILFVSHDINFLSIICNKVLVLKNSKVDFFGDINIGIIRYKESFINNSITNIKVSRNNKFSEKTISFLDKTSAENDYFNLISCYLEQKNDIITIFDEILFCVEICKKDSSNNMYIGIILNSLIDKIPLFSSTMPFFEKNPIIVADNFLIKCKIPKHFINIGAYSITLNISIGLETFFTYTNVIQFSIRPNKEMLSLYSKTVTSLIPVLNWEIIKKTKNN